MILYGKIILSIILSLLAITVVSTLTIAIYILSTSGVQSLEVLQVPFLAALLGLVIFGFTGALYWLILFKITEKKFKTTFSAHAFSAVSSIPITMLIICSLMGWGENLEGILTVLSIFIIILLPVVLLSLYIYKKMYLDSKG